MEMNQAKKVWSRIYQIERFLGQKPKKLTMPKAEWETLINEVETLCGYDKNEIISAKKITLFDVELSPREN